MRASWCYVYLTVAVMVDTVAASNSTLQTVCNTARAKAALPADNIIQGILVDHSSVITSAHHNVSFADEVMYPDAVISYCNVTFAYSHAGLNDSVQVSYWLPAPSKFQDRFLATGGGGLAINSGNMSVAGGISYGAAAGITDGGFGNFDTQWDAVFLLANGTINWPSVYMFGYQAIHEMTVLGKAFTQAFYASTTGTKLYTYYQGCSEGGREGWSQVQRYGGQFDGAIIGAPAMRYGFQQVNHLFSNVVEKTLDYYPPPCELEKIMNLTTAACDGLDGKVDGVVSRTDLCKLHFNMNSTVGKSYYCAATGGTSTGESGPGAAILPTPAQNGTVTAKGARVAAEIIDGLKDSQGRRVYLSYQPTAEFEDATTQNYSATGNWGLDISGLGGEWVYRFLELKDSDDLPSLDGVTYDTLKDWMIQGLHMYSDSLETAWPDLSPFHSAGGKVLHFHGESDPSIPPASSVVYRESVRQNMYPSMPYNSSSDALNEWYRLFLVPGAAHCAPNPYQPNGPFPQTNLAIMIDWVEKGIFPATLNATVLQGSEIGENRQICAWPLRPLWKSNTTEPECVYDQTSIDTWLYNFDGVPVPIF